MKLVRPMKVCLNETCSQVYMNLSDAFPIHCGVKQMLYCCYFSTLL